MGTNLARNFAKKGITLALYNRYVQGSEEQIALKRTQTYPELKEALAFESLSQFINTLEQPRKILIMLPAGSVIDGILNELSPLLSRGDVIIDGGNSHYEDTEKRVLLMAQKKILFLGMGVSGGAEGALHGPSLMVGGDKEGYQIIAKDLENIAAKNRQGNPCCGYLGKGGAGHFVKMVHNGIEYGEMQLLAEIFELNLSSPKSNLETQQKQFSDWNNTESKSYLLEITAEILSYKEKGAPFIDLILDQASNKGTGAWATSIGAATGFPNTLMAAALHARYTSSFKSERIRHAKQLKFPSSDPPKEIPDLKKNYDLSLWINKHQGF
jgi:6-phosphogluconate dehydrogenase